MSKDNKTETAKIAVATKAKKMLMPVIDRIAQGLAALFVLATSYKYVQTWLATNHINQNGSVAAGILVVAIALYLIVRKR